MLAKLVSNLQDHVQGAASALKKVAHENFSPESTPAAAEFNLALMEVESIAADLEQIVFQVEDALQRGVVANQVVLADNSSAAVEDEPSRSNDIDDDDVIPADWTSDDEPCGDTDDGFSVESDRSWRL